MQPSKYQLDILDFVENGHGNGIVRAVAGSGKTSTLVMVAQYLSDAIFLAFNKSIAQELEKRLPSTVQSKTFHGLMYGVLNREFMRRNRGVPPLYKRTDSHYTADLFTQAYGNAPELATVRVACVKLAGLCKANLMHPDAFADNELVELVSAHGITWDNDDVTIGHIIDMVRRILRDGLADWTWFDFDDYLYQVYFADLRIPTFRWILTDEAQDTNLAQRAIIRRMMRRDSRLLFVGDEAQAIYGFRGADSDSMANIARDFMCKDLPLSISYRCPKNVVREAQKIVPMIEASDTAHDGIVRTVTEWRVTEFRHDDLIMCRNTAPLVTLAYLMIGQGVGCKIMGREIGSALVSLVKKVAGKRGTLDTLPDLLEVYRQKEVARCMKNRQEQAAQNVADGVSAILAVMDGMSQDNVARGITGLCDAITAIFANPGDKDHRGNVTLSTVHRAKGLEAPRAFILDRSLMPSKYAVQEWQQIQERNLQYVAITRAMSELVYVDSSDIE